ncbi:MAG: hypothetical protein AABX29_07380 [Nanoarchaeota archaeon]
MKRTLTLILIFLIVLMPVSISLPDAYVSINNGQIHINQNDCSVVDCSKYSEDEISKIKEKSIDDIKDEDVDYLIGALQCDNLVAITAKSIGDIASKPLDIPKGHPITRTIPSLISLTNFDGDRNKVDEYKGRIDNVLYALLYVVDHSGVRISPDDAFFENLVTASVLNPDSKKYVIALLGTLADQSDDFTPYFSKHSLDIFDIVTGLSIDETSGYYFAYGANKILHKIEVDVFTSNNEFPALKKIINLLGESLGYEKSRTIALSAIYNFINDKVVGKPNSEQLLSYFLNGGNNFYLLDRLSTILVQSNPSEKTYAFYSLYNILGHLDESSFASAYKSHLSAQNQLEAFKNSLMEINTVSKSNDKTLYQSSLIFMAEFFDVDELKNFDLNNYDSGALLDATPSQMIRAKRNIPFMYRDFNEIYDRLINEDFRRYSFTLAVWRYMLESGKTVDQSLQEITTIRSRFVSTEILGPDKHLIVFTHSTDKYGQEFKNENIITFAKETGVLEQNIIKDGIEGGNYFFKGPTDKEDILNAIKNSRSETVIWFAGHGSKNALWLDEGKSYRLANGFVESDDTGIRINYIELGDALKSRRDDLNNVIIILDDCFSYDFVQNLYNYLGAGTKPTVITETNRGSYGWINENYNYIYPDGTNSTEISIFLSSLIRAYINSGRMGPLMGSYIIDAEQYSFNKQDSAIFFGGADPTEIASNYFENSECGLCENGVCPV